MSNTAPILIAGGGIGGMATALACARANVRSVVLERAPEFAEIGAGLQLGPNAYRALEALGISADIDRMALRPQRAVMRDARNDDEIMSFDFGTDFVARFGAPYSVMHRGDLLRALMDGCEASGLVTLRSNSEVVAVDQGPGSVTVTCASGRQHEGAMLVGADGVRSAVRTMIGKVSEPRNTGFVAFRATTPRPAEVADEVSLWVGEDFHHIEYPVRDGSLLNRVSVFRARTSTGTADIAALAEQLLEAYEDNSPYLRQAARQLNTSQCWFMFDRDPSPGWAQGRIVLTGDAAHPTLQYLAQGACQALEDAVLFGRLLAQSGDDFARLFERFETERLPRTATAQVAARFVGGVCYLDPIGAAFRNLQLRRRASDDYDILDWLYGPDLDAAALARVQHFIHEALPGSLPPSTMVAPAGCVPS